MNPDSSRHDAETPLAHEQTRVSAVMSRQVVSFAATTRVADALDLARELGVSHLPVLDDDGVWGMVCVCELSDAPPSTLLQQYVRSPAVAIPADATLDDAACLMNGAGVGSLLVLEGDLVGILTVTDLLRAGLADSVRERRCSACGDHHHVVVRRDGRPSLCLECRGQSEPPGDDREIGSGD